MTGTLTRVLTRAILPALSKLTATYGMNREVLFLTVSIGEYLNPISTHNQYP
jgi:hypothetical protein